jgi:hypothetical protein
MAWSPPWFTSSDPRRLASRRSPALQRLSARPVLLVAADRVLHGVPFAHPGLQDSSSALAFQDRMEAAYYATLRAFALLDLPVVGEQVWVHPRTQPPR